MVRRRSVAPTDELLLLLMPLLVGPCSGRQLGLERLLELRQRDGHRRLTGLDLHGLLRRCGRPDRRVPCWRCAVARSESSCPGGELRLLLQYDWYGALVRSAQRVTARSAPWQTLRTSVSSRVAHADPEPARTLACTGNEPSCSPCKAS